jgi:poly(3-hydroxybutyrate) depolymerase
MQYPGKGRCTMRSKSLLTVLLSLSAVACSAGGPSRNPGAALPASRSPPQQRDEIARRVQSLLERPDRSPYGGWLKYLLYRAEHGPAQQRARSQLLEWAERIEANPRALQELRGTHEWAYESPVDGSGQPFTIHVPTDYDPSSPAPLLVFLHGRGGDQHARVVDWRAHPGYFEVAPLGRSRASGFVALGEADVLQVIEYVEQQFNIDPDRVHLWGVSMGGFGTTWLGARHPDRFASLRPVCGSATDVPLENLLTVPVRALHGEDDWGAPIVGMRGPLSRLLELGGDATLDATTGYGHRVWEDRDHMLRGREWALGQRRRKSRDVREIDFTAFDGNAARDYWGAIEEWGPEPRPARFSLRAAPDNVLRVALDNVRRLKLWLRESPLDTSRAVSIVPSDASRSGSRPLTIDPRSSPDPVVIEADATGALQLAESAIPPFRLHTPGGANQLYAGEPLLIVYGTGGDTRERAALEAAARAASQSANSSWATDDPALPRPAGVPLFWNVYGSLPIRADVDVTAEELAGHHLVLIGTAEQNAVVRRLADRLPVRVSKDRIEFDDGLTIPTGRNTLRLVHYNPLAPQRLLYWVAASHVDAYASHWALLDLLGVNPDASDALVSDDAHATLLLGRSFDSRWHWLPRTGSPVIEADASWQGTAERVADRARQRTKADFALAQWPVSSSGSIARLTPGLTRLSDVLPYYAPLSRATLSGQQLLDAQAVSSAASFEGGLLAVRLVPTPLAASIDPARAYSVVMTAGGMGPFFGLTHLAPQSFVQTALSLSEGR